MARSFRLMSFGEMISPEGRVSRTQYITHLALYSIAIIPFIISIFLIYTSDMSFDKKRMMLISLTLISLPLALAFLFLTIKRVHDLGMPAVVAAPLYLFLPLFFIFGIFAEAPETLRMVFAGTAAVSQQAQIGMGAYFLLAPGEKGGNKYGLDPLAEDDEL